MLIVSLAVALVCWGSWYWRLARVSSWLSPRRQRSGLFLTPVLCLALLFLVLKYLAAADVRQSGVYLSFYVVVGAAWVGLAGSALPWFGLDPRLDVAERRNAAASTAISGALLGATCCLAGGNVGDGPGCHVVLFSALLSTGGFFLAWLVLERLTGTAEAITVERDQATGLRLAGWLVALGLILGYAVTGTWVSAADTLTDFLWCGWPVLPLTGLAAVLHWSGAPSPTRPRPDRVGWGVLPAALYLALALTYLGYRGWWQP
jgi:hypothetical protein